MSTKAGSVQTVVVFIIRLLPGAMAFGKSHGILVRGLDVHSEEKHLSNDKGQGQGSSNLSTYRVDAIQNLHQ